MKKLILALLTACVVSLCCSCMDTAKYNYTHDHQWLTQQLEQGKITQQQYQTYSSQIAK